MTSLTVLSSLVVFLLLTSARASAFAEPENKQLLAGLKVSRALLAAPAPAPSAPAPAPAPFTLGAFLPNSDPSCDPQWAYETGCYSDYSCAKGHICTCKNGDRCADGSYFGIFLCPCDEAPQIPSPPPRRRPPPPPPPPPGPPVLKCLTPSTYKCLAAYNQTDAIAKCNATGGSITFTSSAYTCTCCKGSATFSATPPSPRGPPPPPPRIPNYGKQIRNHVWTIIGSVWGSIAGVIIICVICCRCWKKRNKARAATRAGDIEQPPLVSAKRRANTRKGSKATTAKKWFEPGYRGPGFQTTKAGLFFSKSLPKNERFAGLLASMDASDEAGLVELFASASDEAGPSNAAHSANAAAGPSGEGRGATGESSPTDGAYAMGGVNSGNTRTGKGKEPEAPAADPPAPASIDGLPEDEICIVCCNAPKECVFVPCGHHATCMACGHLVQQQGGKGCPVCRRPIERVLRIYEA